jgi:putative ABC transport system permease protein
VNLVEDDVAERVAAAQATPSVWRALGITPAAGRLLSDADGAPGADPLVLLSYDFWQSRFNGSHGVVGRTLLVNGRLMTVAGVLPAGVRLPMHYHYAEPPGIFLPHRIERSTTTARGSHFLDGVARLAPGWTLEAANAEVSRVAQEFAAEYPQDYPAPMRFDTYVRPIHADIAGGARPLLLLLVGAVAILLLIACANVAGLVLTRTEERRRELAVRSALGAGRWRIARQLLIEQLVLAAVAGAAGVLIAYGAAQALFALRPDEIPRLGDARVDVRLLAFTAGVSVVTALVVALAPLRFGAAFQSALREAGGRTTATRASHRARRALIVTEVALSIVLLAGAGLLLRSFANLLAVDPGYRTEQVLAAPVSLPTSRYLDDDSRRRFFAHLVSEAARLPGVVAAGAVLNLPLDTDVGDINIQIEGRAVDETDVSPRLDFQVVTPGWFDVMRIDIVRGRGILGSDDARNPGAVVLSESAARKYWSDSDPIGKRFRLGGGAGPGWVTVVGIVRDVRHGNPADELAVLMYLPHAQFTFWNGGLAPASMTLVLHTRVEPVTLIPPLREQLERMDAHVPLGNARSMAQVLSTAVAEPRFATSLLVTFAVLALALAMLGVYGLVGYTVARRAREIAVRMALGAEPRGVVRQMIRQGMEPVVAGVVIGGVAALALTRLLQPMLYGVTPHDPLAMVGAFALLCGTALAACLIPARRATRVAPLSALRDE